MKTMKRLKLAIVSLFLLVLSLPAFAGSITNTFNADTLHPQILTGGNILGSYWDDNLTVWDGIYRGGGEIIGGGLGGSGSGITVQADSTTFPGFMTVNQANGDWSGTGDDGFFLFKLVSGNFDAIVENAGPYNAVPNHFSGLLVRGFTDTNGWLQYGTPYNTNATALNTNPVENWFSIFRMNQFGQEGEIRIANNAGNAEAQFGSFPNAPGATTNNSFTNVNLFFRISRSNDFFYFYKKSNALDPWFIMTNQQNSAGLYTNTAGFINQTNWHNQPVQVGIANAMFATANTQTFFGDFEITNANVGAFPVVADPTGLTGLTNGTNTVKFTWTPGAGNAGSVLVVRRNSDPNSTQPADGFVFVGNTNYNFGNNALADHGTNWLYNSSNWVAFVGATNGSGTESVTVNGFGNSNITYFARVYGYSGSGTNTAYSKNPAGTSVTGPGTLSSITFTLSPTNIPVGGVASATVIATYTSGDTINISNDPNAVFTSSDPTVALATNGVITGMGLGTATITNTYFGVSVSNSVSTHIPAFVDNFGVNHDYISNGVTGSSWDGMYLKAGDIGGTTAAAAPASVVNQVQANSLTNNQLVVNQTGGAWAGNTDDGFFLWKLVTNDFQTAVHVASISLLDNQMAGVMGRATSSGTGARLSGGENFTWFLMFDRFNIPTFMRDAINGADTQEGNAQTAATFSTTNHYWLLVQKIGTTFNFYQRLTNTDGYVKNPNLASRVNANMTNGLRTEVGLAAADFGAGSNTVAFDSFMLDSTSVSLTNIGTPPAGSPAPAILASSTVGSLHLALSWTAVPGASGYLVLMRQSGHVSAQPISGTAYTANTNFGSGSQIGNGNFVVYNSTGTNVNVSAPAGFPYSAAVYAYNTNAPNPSYGVLAGATANDVVLGTLDGVFIVADTRSTVNGANIPRGGAGFVKVFGSYSSNVVNVTTTQAAKFGFSVDNTNILAFSALNGPNNPNITLTGLSNGIANLTVFLTNSDNTASVSNTVPVVVRDPHFAYEFTNSHDYALNGVAGTVFEGVYNTSAGTATPGGQNQPGGPPAVTIADENITSNGWLTVQTSVNYGWEGGEGDGFLLWKRVPGDFFTSIQINTNGTTAGFHNPGVLARFYGPTDIPYGLGTNVIGAAGTNFNESFYSMSQILVGPYARRNNNGGVQQRNIGGAANGAQLYIGMARTDSTNWYFFWRTNNTLPWRSGLPSGLTGGMYFGQNAPGFNTTTLHPDPVQLGIMDATYNTAGPYLTQYAHFMIDVGSPQIINTFISGGNLVIQYSQLFPLGTLQGTASLTPTSWVNIPTGAPTAAGSNGLAQITVPVTNALPYTYFRLKQ